MVVLILGLVSGFGLRGFCHGDSVMWSGVLRECSFLKCVCRMLMILVGSLVICLVAASLIASRLGLSLALGWRPVVFLRLL